MKKVLITLALLLSLSALGFSQGLEFWVDAQTGKEGAPGTQEDPLLSISKAVSMIPDGATGKIHLNGIFTETLSIKNRYFGELIVNGHGNTLIYGFEGEPEIPFDPTKAHVWKYSASAFQDCRNIIVKNMEIWGNTGIESIQKSPDKWLKKLTFDHVTFKYGAGRTVFSGAYTYEDLTFIDCVIRETIYDPSACTHDVYLSGGHWENSIGLPPVTGITFIRCRVGYAGGRHGIQLNGRFIDILVDGCTLWHNEFAGLSFIGCQNVEVLNCEIWGNNRQGIVCYTYFDTHYFNITTPEGLRIWMGCHHPMKNFDIHHNSIMVGPTQWLKYDSHNNKPQYQACVLINDNVAEYLAWENGLWDWATSNMNVYDNVLISPWNNIIECSGLCEAMSLSAHGNWVWTYDPTTVPMVRIPYGQVDYPFTYLDEEYPEVFYGHIVRDPKIKVYPEYDLVDLALTPKYDFSKHPSKGNLFSSPAAVAGKGKKYSMIWIPGKGIKEIERKVERTQIPVDKINPPGAAGLNLDIGGTDG